MERIKTQLQGKRTYFVAAIGLLYMAGVWLGFWELDERVLATLGLGGLAFLRSAVGKPGGAPGRETTAAGSAGGSGPAAALLLAGALGLLAPGCGTLDPAGPYRGDQVLYEADTVLTTSYDALHNYVQWEYEHQAALAPWPEIKASADYVRANARAWVATGIALREAYAADPTRENREALQRGLAVIRAALLEAAKYRAGAQLPEALRGK